MYIKKIIDLKLNNNYSNMTIRDNYFHVLDNNTLYIYNELGQKTDKKNFLEHIDQ